MSESIQYVGMLAGHDGWVTKIATIPSDPNTIVSASRDKTILVWQLNHDNNNADGLYGVPKRRLTGHGHFVSDVVVSANGEYAVSGSWDKTLRLWDLTTGVNTVKFIGHEKDVLSVAFSPAHNQIVSGSRDNTIRLWNIHGQCRYVFEDHKGWVSCVTFSPDAETHNVVSCSWDKSVKIWNLDEGTVQGNNIGHQGYLNSVAIAPDSSLCASGGKDSVVMLWDMSSNKVLYNLEAGKIINCLVFSPNRYWLCAAVGSTIKIWDIAEKKVLIDLEPTPVNGDAPTGECNTLAWSADGCFLFAGYQDGIIRVYQVL